MKIARLIRVEGRVQGVWFRDYAVQAARRLGVVGWVRNRRDGSVEAMAIGSPDAVEGFIAALRSGSPGSRVERIQVEEAEPADVADFSRRATE